jgi:mannobiose 2-epimerase
MCEKTNEWSFDRRGLLKAAGTFAAGIAVPWVVRSASASAVERPKQHLAALHAQIAKHLEEGIIPFWLKRAWDRQHGGFLTNFDERGGPYEMPEKYLNTQCRLLWWFSTLTRHYPQRKEFKDLAVKGFDFIEKHFWDPKYGGWYWKIKRDGSPLDKGKVVYGQSFAIYATSEFYRSTRDPRGLSYAQKTFDLLQKYCADTLRGGYFENLKPDWTVEAPGFYAGDRKGLDTHMHLMEAFTVLFQASGEDVHRRKLMEITDLIIKHMIDPESGAGRNQFDLDFKPIPAIAINRTWNAERAGDKPAIPTDTTSYGHNIELAWLMNRAVQEAKADAGPYLKPMRGLLDHAVKNGVDWEYGGVYRDGTAKGAVLIKDKEFWQNSEALVGFLDGYETFGDKVFLDAFEKVWEFASKFMIIPGVGEWRTLLDREGRPIDPKIGNPWKVSYHTGRAALECKLRLEKMK